MSRTLIAAASSMDEFSDTEAAGTEADLIDGFFPRDVENAAAGAGEAGGGLQQQGGFADTGVAPDQDHRGRNQAAAEYAIEFGDADGRAGWRFGAAGEADEGDTPANRRLGGGAGAGDDGFLLDSVPFAADFAAASPFQGDRAARLTDEAGGGLGQWDSVSEGSRLLTWFWRRFPPVCGDPALCSSECGGPVGAGDVQAADT